jgi:integrase
MKKTHHIAKIGKVYYLQICIDGERTQKALVDDAGQKIGSMDDAIIARDKLMAAQYGGKRKEALLEHLINRLGVETEKQQKAAADERTKAKTKPDIPISMIWQAYLDSANRPDTGKATLRQYACQFARFVKWVAEAHPEAKAAGNIGKPVAVDFMRHLKKQNLSPNTQGKYANLLMLVWNTLKKSAKVAQDDPSAKHVARISANPWTDDTITRPTLEKGTGRRELTLLQLKAVCESAEGELRGLLMLGLYCGLRLGDAARLNWQDVDLIKGAIVTDLHKTDETVAIPIAEPLRRELEAVPETERRGPILPGFAKAYRRRPQAIHEMIKSHFAKSGIQTSEKIEGRARAVARRGFHSLRHSFVSYACASGWPESLVKAIVGHRSETVTRLYQHQSLEMVKHLAPLPDVLAGEVELKGLPLPHHDDDAKELRKQIRKIVDNATAEDWKQTKARLIEILDAEKTGA